MFSFLSTLLKSLNRGWLKNMLTGAGLTLGTSAITLTALNAAISAFKGNAASMSSDILGLAHIAGFDYFFSIILGAIVAKNVQSATNIGLKKITK